MTTFALIHGAWGSAWHWAGVPGRLRALGHDVVAADLPCDDPAQTFDDYATAVTDALSGVQGDDVVLVGFSLGGLTTPLVAARRPVRGIVYVAAMLVQPGLSLFEQLGRGDAQLLPEYASGLEGPDEQARFRWTDVDVYGRVGYDADAPREVVQERFERLRPQATAPYAVPCGLEAQPAVPTAYLLCAEDRLMNNAFWREAVPERLGIDPVEIPGSHTPIVSRPERLVELITSLV